MCSSSSGTFDGYERVRPMKTLDEVIKALEMCTADNCVCLSGCPYSYLADGDDGCEYHAIPAMQTDALYYLKWFRARDNMSRKLDREDNEPLTWEELKNMEGMPVWVEEIGRKYSTPHWAIHNGIMDGYDGDENLYLQPFEVLTKFTLGKTWQAYRKEHHEN